MIGLVLVTHGRLAEEFVAATEHVVGRRKPARTPFALAPTTTWSSAARTFSMPSAPSTWGDGVIVLTDMFGGTPSNLAISIMDKANVEVIAGVNLPMLIKLARARASSDLQGAVAAAQEAGRAYIHVASRLLEGGEA